jgi:2-octaprenyl-6-methoxyphenol hydroxylase
MSECSQPCEVAICGGGPVGMVLALALEAAGRRCILIDSGPAAAKHRPGADPRTLALSYGSRMVLERVGAWERLASTPILSVHVSQQGGFGRTLLNASDEDVPALGYVIGFGEFEHALRQACIGRVTVLHAARVTGVSIEGEVAVVSYTQDGEPQRLQAKLAAIADGGGDASQPGSVERNYKQTAIVADVTPAQSHHNRAWERFARSGPIALLPKGKDCALVWSVRPDAAATLAAAPDAEFLDRLGEAMGGRAGPFAAAGPRRQFPLVLRFRREIAGERRISLGNAAQSLHPVAGQGLNLGLRDAWALVQTLRDQADCGSAAVLSAYVGLRRLDRFGAIGFTDLLARAFTFDSGLMRVGRGAALTVFDLLPPARHFLARRMIFGASAWP